MQTKFTLYHANGAKLFGSHTAIMPSSCDSGSKQNKVYIMFFYIIIYIYIYIYKTCSIGGGGAGVDVMLFDKIYKLLDI